MDNKYVICNGELYHYGVRGMRWGVRKTPASTGQSRNSSKGSWWPFKKKAQPGNDNKNSKLTEKQIKKMKLSEVPDDVLKARIARLDLERRYKELSAQVNPPKSTRGRDFTLRVMEKIGENTLVNIGTQAANKGLGTAINKMFGVDSDDVVNRIVNPNKGQSDKK